MDTTVDTNIFGLKLQELFQFCCAFFQEPIRNLNGATQLCKVFIKFLGGEWILPDVVELESLHRVCKGAKCCWSHSSVHLFLAISMQIKFRLQSWKFRKIFYYANLFELLMYLWELHDWLYTHYDLQKIITLDSDSHQDLENLKMSCMVNLLTSFWTVLTGGRGDCITTDFLTWLV